MEPTSVAEPQQIIQESAPIEQTPQEQQPQQQQQLQDQQNTPRQEARPQSAAKPKEEPARNIQSAGKNYQVNSSNDSSQFAKAKSFLQKSSPNTNMNVYDHLTACVSTILEQRPENAIDMFETLSREIKIQRQKTTQETQPLGILSVQINQQSMEQAKKVLELIQSNTDGNADAAQQEEHAEMPDMFETGRMLEWAGISFGNEETYRLVLSIKQLASENGLKSVRLFGKFLGMNNDFYVVESEPGPETPLENQQGETNQEEEQIQKPKEVDSKFDIVQGLENQPELLALMDSVAQPKPPVVVDNLEVTKEEPGVGANRYVYWVAKSSIGPWVRLPDVNPKLVQISRKIRKLLTGNLEENIESFPAFHGTEADYLRSLIARISSATVVSPGGYYIFESDEENEENDTGSSRAVIVNPEFENNSVEALLQLSGWVHHVSYLLPQGRTTWTNPLASLEKGDKEGAAEGEEDEAKSEGGEQEEGNQIQLEPETGPALLSPLDQDEDVESGLPTWTVKPASSKLPQKLNVIVLRNHRWPGAVTVGYQDKFANIYVGDGLKYNPSYSVPSLPAVKNEYGIRKEVNQETNESTLVFPTDIQEQVDPTTAEEKAFEEAKKQKAEENQEGDEGEEGEKEEEGSEEGDQ